MHRLSPGRIPPLGLAALGASAALLAACSGEVIRPPVDGQPVTLQVSANVSATTVATVVVEVTAADIPTSLVFNLVISGGVAGGSVTVPAGSGRTFTMRAYDAGGVLTHSGSVTTAIVAGSNPNISIILVAGAGDVSLDVTLGEFSVAVSPPVSALTTGQTVQLSVTITDANDAPVVELPVWASDKPGVATVNSSGLVTAESPGTAIIYATYQGAAGAATVTVTAP